MMFIQLLFFAYYSFVANSQGGIKIRDELKRMVKNTYDHKYSIPLMYWRRKQKDPSTLWRDVREIGIVLSWIRSVSTDCDPTWISRSDLVPKILDLGCGDGRIAFPAMKVGLGVVGVDFSSYGLKSAFQVSKRTKEPFTSQFLVADVENLPFRNHSLSFIYCIGTFEYFNNLVPTLREVHRILDPNGKILFNFRNEGSVRTRAFLRNLVRKLFRQYQNSTLRTPQVSRSRKWKNQYHRLEKVVPVLHSCQFVVIRTYGYFVFHPSDIEKLHHFIRAWVSRRTSKLLRLLDWLLRWLDWVLGTPLIGNRLASVIAVEAHKSAQNQ